MTGIEWESLPAAVRDRIDELVLADEWFRAVTELWRGGWGQSGTVPHGDTDSQSTSDPQTDSDSQSGADQRIPLNHCQVLVHRRRAALADRIRHKPQPPRDLETLIAKVAALPTPPDAIEAIWDGDSQGWMVQLIAVTAEPRTSHLLAQIRHGGDIRLFNGVAPPWPEAHEATEVGTRLAKRFSVPFYFESPDTPDLPDLRWWDTV